MNFAKQGWNYLPCGLREPLLFLLLTGVVGLAGSLTGTFNLYGPLALWPSEFWYGHVWQVVTYVLLPFGPADLIFNSFLFAVLGTRLVMGLGRREFWVFCLLGMAGTAVTKLALSPFNQGGLVGIGGMIFAMFAAWARLFANEEVMMMATWRMRMRTAILIIAGLIIIFSLFTPCGFWNGLAILGGGASGWLYLVAQSFWRSRRGPLVVPSERISRLEL